MRTKRSEATVRCRDKLLAAGWRRMSVVLPPGLCAAVEEKRRRLELPSFTAAARAALGEWTAREGRQGQQGQQGPQGQEGVAV